MIPPDVLDMLTEVERLNREADEAHAEADRLHAEAAADRTAAAGERAMAIDRNRNGVALGGEIARQRHPR